MKKIPIYVIILALISSFAITDYQVFATDTDFYSANDILFYNPTDTGCVSAPSGTSTSPNSKNNQEITAKYLFSTNFLGNNNKPMNAVQMAAIIGNLQQESGLNPNSGEGGSHRGIVQWSIVDRWNKIANPKNDLNNQLNFIKIELDGVYKDSLSEFWNASEPTDLNKATYAIARNYEVALKNSGGSTSWTNDTDASNNLQNWTERKEYAQSAYNDFGNLAGSGYVPGASCGGLVSGGMTLAAAQTFVNEYKSLEPKDWASGTPGTIYDINGTNCSGGSLANCVAFSQYFINRYTSKKYVNTSDGRGVVKDLIALGLTDGSHTPKAYAIFSRNSGSYGHTGVVLGVDTANNKIIIGEAACGNTLDWTDARERSLSEFSSDDYTYAYTDNVLKGGAL